MGGADSWPWIMLAKPGMSVSPPDEPLASSEISDSVSWPRCRQSVTAADASMALVCVVLPAESIA
ncbi:hypothetical protein TKWG_11950 [Advenella kashmirensis WT001]|uniref:Uncharacterized protein n=1 Tax=Advenella kashmirensis (strain DSM 17095 / LMG 22695 / WT001) TaxID=1036672 RepID=I3UC34_ADVKW|nr:hypothetical protein TKWG_11950 [Advenella kashmirensis WT001]